MIKQEELIGILGIAVIWKKNEATKRARMAGFALSPLSLAKGKFFAEIYHDIP